MLRFRPSSHPSSRSFDAMGPRASASFVGRRPTTSTPSRYTLAGDWASARRAITMAAIPATTARREIIESPPPVPGHDGTASHHSPRQGRWPTELSKRSGRCSVLLLDLPGEAGHRVLADHRLADGVRARDAGDGDVLALFHAIEVHVHHDLVVFLA